MAGEGRALKNGMKKLKSSIGFTLSETLITVLILVMVSGVVAGGLPSAVTAYSKAVDAANAQVLISTTINALRAELSTARGVHLSNGTSGDPIYFSSATGSKAKIYKENDVIMVQDFLMYDESGPQKKNGEAVPARDLVSKSAVTNGLKVSYSSTAWQDPGKVLVFNGLKVTKNNVTVASIDRLYIRCFEGSVTT